MPVVLRETASAPVAVANELPDPAPFTPVPRLYSADDTDVQPPVVIEQAMPRWTPPHELLRRRTFSGRVQIIIGVDGRVTSADVVRTSFNAYDDQVLRATKTWRYQPATKRGYPVEYRRTVDYTLNGQ